VTNGSPFLLPSAFSKATSVEVSIESILLQRDSVLISVADVGEGRTLVLEYKDLLTDPEWKTLGTNETGKTLLIDPAPPLDRSRYYRVRVE
jgi:hypothetical protein